ncbi:NAD-dependent epimerase/dehydratase family protein [Aurantimonas sp. HBX-1]|uniref:NAD-dependent epimerase/dehydratase family protein n=1 Tax=Aurantimonas sp. HBX-1 TaxID=2906072 RepID=UPI001F2312B0|nr:NAD-dependent epimerase/dehydratase family protein [Aurantimonas sp. HBX-1]UIJ73806.1 NAD-dependent epimerase/dehydratase family protein [Aurantimonas sp. HBX-1]
MAADTVLLTGISGFIAKHVALRLLERGYRVRGSVRSAGKGAEVRATLAHHGAQLDRLEIVEADLLADAGWAKAAAGCRFVVHTASPFPLTQPRDRFALVPAARQGTLRVIAAANAAGAERLVMTSSIVAVYQGHTGRTDARYGEADWSNIDDPSVGAYAVSKTVAECAAWEVARESGLELAVINPAFVLGPLLDADAGTSATLIAMMMRGRAPLVPDISFGIVDVRDVADAHVAAMERQAAAGRRFILSAGTRSLLEIGRHLAVTDPSLRRRVPRFVLPDSLVRAAALVSPQARLLVPELGRPKDLDAGPARSVLDIVFRQPEAAIAAMAASLKNCGIVR